ncbi:high-affinity Zn(2+) transporter zrt1 [Mortierella sp. GBA43]|nr:high-affinity Zn(2+) transporter zrt1 [Mortierella sp. GBA43]
MADECSTDEDMSEYNTRLHVASVFIILAASTVGVFMPVIASKVRILRLSNKLLTLGKQFGTGVILATAFIHMMPTAMANLSSPCLGSTFSEKYTAFGGVFILLSSLFMHWIEFVAVEHNERRIREAAVSQGLEDINIDLGELGAIGVAAVPCPVHNVEGPCNDSCSSISSCEEVFPASEAQHRAAVNKSRGSSVTHNDPSFSQAAQSQERDHVQEKHMEDDQTHNHRSPHAQETGHSHAHGLSLLDESQRRISTYILEAGIAAHSVIIGVSLGVSTGSEFTGLLIALVFHQFFEGFALGARIADLAFDTSYTHYILALIFSLTTPVGAAIGIGVSSTYNSSSKTSLLVEGVFDSISTGILLYMGYVNLLAIEFNLNSEIRRQSKKLKSMYFLALWLGATVMAVIGRFA